MKVQREFKVLSSDLSLEDREVITKLAEDSGQPLLVTADGQAVELPAAIRQLLVFAGNAMSKKKAIYVVQEDRAMTTQ